MEPTLHDAVSLYAEKILEDFCVKNGVIPEVRFEKLLRKDFGSSSPSGLGPQFRASVTFNSPVTGPIHVECIAHNKKTARKKAATALLNSLMGQSNAAFSSEVIFTPQGEPSTRKLRSKCTTDKELGTNNSTSAATGTEISTRTDSSTTASAGSDGMSESYHPDGTEDNNASSTTGVPSKPKQPLHNPVVSEKQLPKDVGACHVDASAAWSEMTRKGRKRSAPLSDTPATPVTAGGQFHSIHANAIKLARMQFFTPHISGEVVRTVYAHSEVQMRAAFHWAATFTNELRRLQGTQAPVTPAPAPAPIAKEAIMSRPNVEIPEREASFGSSPRNGVLPAGTPVVTPIAFDGVNFGYTLSTLPFDIPIIPPGTAGFVPVGGVATLPTPTSSGHKPAESADKEVPSTSSSDMLPHVRLRVATAEDVPHIMRFIRELAEFEREPHAVKTDERTLLRDGFGSHPVFHVMLAELPAEMVGVKTPSNKEVQPEVPTATGRSTTTSAAVAKTPTAPTASRNTKSWVSIVKGKESSVIEADAHPSPPTTAATSPATPVSVVPESADSHVTAAATEYVPVGMALCYVAYSTWEGRVLYLEDLYITPDFRRHGISRLLFTALARAAYVGKCARMQWTVLHWNESAITAYTAPPIEAQHLKDWDIYRLNSSDIARIAGAPSVRIT